MVRHRKVGQQLRRVRNCLTQWGMIESRLTAKSQTTVPRAVRAALGANPGDRLAWQLDGNRVVLTLVDDGDDDATDPFALFTEWSDAIDSAAFKDF